MYHRVSHRAKKQRTSYRIATQEIFCNTSGVGVKADCLKKGPRPIGGMPTVGVFLRDPSPYLREFGENHLNITEKVYIRKSI